MESILEKQRNLHEERERIQDTMVKEMIAKKVTHREQINSDHRIKILLDRYVSCTETLADVYSDQDGARAAELDSIKGPNEFSQFYSRLKDIKDNYKNNANEIAVPMASEFDDFLKMRDQPSEANLIDFTDEEGYGKFLDLNDCHRKYLNLKGVMRVDYLSYLSIFDRLFDIPKDKKTQGEYKKYLQSLLDYLHDFCTKVKPLLNLEEVLENAVADMERQFNAGTFPGWPKETGSAMSHTGAALDLSGFSSCDELASLGLDRLKSALMALGLKCGGTLEDRAQRLWSTKDKQLDELDPSLFVKTKGGKAVGRDSTDKQRDLASLETQIYAISEILSETRQSTKENVQRKQARTAGEREDSDEEASQSESEEEDDSEVVYNPKNLPLGWDGKPIPYWLYKLHGLNVSYTCEICGNAKYQGPKAFQRHFAEWRHAHGMRCLGIPNTAHFANVTSIEDALKLWHKLKDEKQKEKFQPANEEEYEDSEGRVVNKKTFEDLQRQGLL
ncbi:Splicing factor 3A subunit 3 [Halotydeus destructor]|nr:Splicing factor 3A subunit 3 [Halotydeus destructor]